MHGIRWVMWSVGGLGVGLLVWSHWVHALGVFPYLVLLACPLMHIFHRGHGVHHHAGGETTAQKETHQ